MGINYDKAPNTKFPTGSMTTVNVKATDGSGNSSTCSFNVYIEATESESE